ncbi:hypothetical protein [Xylanibacter oryzae]|uniref:hypothetical protein n=1 Tax=Xylanibacter oryzae TaxID=185293 RepID=UPI0004B8E0D6|nr:hypothetical protein [Xylanibacter oryzae]
MSEQRNELKDKAVYALIYGGGAAIKYGIFAAAIAAHLIHPAAARGIKNATRNATKMQLDQMWNEYKRTGKISSIFDVL